MTLLVDTSVLLADRAEVDPAERWSVSVISIGELQAGVVLARTAEERSARLRRLTSVLTTGRVLAIDTAVAARYADLRAASGRRPSNDLWIAASALAHSLTLVTADRDQAALPLITARLVT